MMSKIEGKLEVKTENNVVITSWEGKIKDFDTTVPQDIVFEYIPEGQEGGPLMRPKHPRG